MKLGKLLHILITIFTLLISFAPMKFIRKGLYFIPLCSSTMWLILGKCPLKGFDDTPDDKTFFQVIFSDLGIIISRDFSIYLATFFVCLIPTIIIYRLLHS